MSLQIYKYKINNIDQENNIQLLENICIKTHIEKKVSDAIYGDYINLNKYRNCIDTIDSNRWKKIRWYINNYDFTVPSCIINRAFYKYWEMINEFNIFKEYDDTNDIIVHCAEAPGGFIQGTNIKLNINNKIGDVQNKPDEEGYIHVKKYKNNEKIKIFSISLNKNIEKYKHYNLPSYNKNILNTRVKILYGEDNTGDLNNIKNINYLKTHINSKCFFITGDGGFDEGNEFNNKEQLHYNLILNEIIACIQLLRKNGHFIIKIFDIFTETSIHLLYTLSILFSEVYIYKPLTSRPTNSEKYIVCKYYKDNEEYNTVLLNELKKLSIN